MIYLCCLSLFGLYFSATGKYGTDVQFMTAITLQATGMTFLMTSYISGRHAKEEFIQSSKAAVFATRFQAMVSMYCVHFVSLPLPPECWDCHTINIFLWACSPLSTGEVLAMETLIEQTNLAFKNIKLVFHKS